MNSSKGTVFPALTSSRDSRKIASSFSSSQETFSDLLERNQEGALDEAERRQLSK
jgi:hypothetical protein